MTLQSGYMKSLVKVAHESLKARCVVFNFRGRGGHPLKTPRTYCATNWEDLDSILGTVYILGQCSELLEPVTCFAELVETGLWAV